MAAGRGSGWYLSLPQTLAEPSSPRSEVTTSSPPSTTASRLRVLRIYPRLDQKTAIQFVDCVCQRLHPSPSTTSRPTFNGPDFGSSFHYHVLDKGIGPLYQAPHTSAQCKVERSHHIISPS
jgi:hypothetical protein